MVWLVAMLSFAIAADALFTWLPKLLSVIVSKLMSFKKYKVAATFSSDLMLYSAANLDVVKLVPSTIVYRSCDWIRAQVSGVTRFLTWEERQEGDRVKNWGWIIFFVRSASLTVPVHKYTNININVTFKLLETTFNLTKQSEKNVSFFTYEKIPWPVRKSLVLAKLCN